MSDVHLTENSGLIQKLLPGDIILADQGFSVEDAARLYCTKVKMPSFIKA